MKIKDEHYKYIQKNIQLYLDKANIDMPYCINRYEALNLSMKRMWWDISYASGLTKWICDNLYSYMNDDHIDTALRKITGTK